MNDYTHFHQNRLNLAIHALMVPVFVASAFALAGNLLTGRWRGALALAAGPILSLALQGFGHRREVHPPLPFAGPGDFLGRIFTEQFFRFPAFVLSGEWKRAWRRAGRTH
ncbi:MAG TPA: terminase [Vicinamibacteria bacterium]|jgi:hypothetical protein|nr:terminase [Vicinamibacteria bacterium]